MDRIKTLRKKAVRPTPSLEQLHYYFFKHYKPNTSLPLSLRHAEALKFAFLNITPEISDGELIVGKCTTPISDNLKKEWEEEYLPFAIDTWANTSVGQNSHMSIDYPLLLDKGINGILEIIDEKMTCCREDQKDFYMSCEICLEAVINHSITYAKKAEDMALKTDDPARKEELMLIAETCRNVPANPARSFYEAVQSVHFVTYAISLAPFFKYHMQFQLGHPDRYLLKYYQADIKSGKLTKDYAQLLLDLLGIQINMRVPSGLSSGYMVGGRDKDGNIVANDLTMMCMQVIDDLRLVYPAVGFCYTKDMPDIYLEKACEILSHGCSHPAIFSDDTISAGLKSYGLSEEESHDYIHSTCVEITPTASSHVWVASPYLNTAQFLLDIMDREYDSFDSLMSALFDRFDREIEHQTKVYTDCRKTRAEHAVNPLLSCFVNDCLDRGLDIEQGGAKYNWIMPSFIGMANLVDSLMVLKEVVFDKKEFTISSLKDILDKNFEGFEPLRQRFLNTIPKYGNDIDEVDTLFTDIVNHIVSECGKYKSIHTGGDFVPSVFCWVMHERYGSVTGATPDGRPAFFPLGDGSGPCQGREKNGPTASILSSTKWSHKELIGGVAVNMKFGKKHFSGDSLKNLTALIKTYISRGGFELQINVVDREILEAAQKTPENYKDLVVRIGGYSDYFVNLSPQMQAEVILRTGHNV